MGQLSTKHGLICQKGVDPLMLVLQVKFDYTSLAMAVATDCSINDEFLFNN